MVDTQCEERGCVVRCCDKGSCHDIVGRDALITEVGVLTADAGKRWTPIAPYKSSRTYTMTDGPVEQLGLASYSFLVGDGQKMINDFVC